MELQQIESGAQYVRLSKVTEMVDLSPASIWRRIKVNDFPAPIKLSSNCARWDRALVLRWLEGKRQESQAARKQSEQIAE